MKLVTLAIVSSLMMMVTIFSSHSVFGKSPRALKNTSYRSHHHNRRERRRSLAAAASASGERKAVMMMGESRLHSMGGRMAYSNEKRHHPKRRRGAIADATSAASHINKKPKRRIRSSRSDPEKKYFSMHSRGERKVYLGTTASAATASRANPADPYVLDSQGVGDALNIRMEA